MQPQPVTHILTRSSTYADKPARRDVRYTPYLKKCATIIFTIASVNLDQFS